MEKTMPAIRDDGFDRFELRRMPNGIYCIDGRIVPVRCDASDCIDDNQLIVRVNESGNMGKRLTGVKFGAHVEK